MSGLAIGFAMTYDREAGLAELANISAVPLVVVTAASFGTILGYRNARKNMLPQSYFHMAVGAFIGATSGYGIALATPPVIDYIGNAVGSWFENEETIKQTNPVDACRAAAKPGDTIKIENGVCTITLAPAP